MERVKHLASNIEKTFEQEISSHQEEINNLIKFKIQFKSLTRDFLSSN